MKIIFLNLTSIITTSFKKQTQYMLYAQAITCKFTPLKHTKRPMDILPKKNKDPWIIFDLSLKIIITFSPPSKGEMLYLQNKYLVPIAPFHNFFPTKKKIHLHSNSYLCFVSMYYLCTMSSWYVKLYITIFFNFLSLIFFSCPMNFLK